MYFDIKPKDSAKDLFGADFLLKTLRGHINDKSVRLLVIKGLRRTGKTSLLNVVLQESGYDYVKIDVRAAPYYDRNEFHKFLIEKLEEKYRKVKRLVSKMELKVFYKDLGAGVSLRDRPKPSFFEDLNKELKKRNKYIIIAFDEVQLLKKIEFNQMLASIYDNYGQIKLVITGSEVGMLDDFIGKDDGKSPLFGRPHLEIETKKTEKEKSAEFLLKGSMQINKEFSVKEVEEVVEELDGIIGWLTAYGWFRSQNINHKDSLERAIQEGTGLAKTELERFLEGRKAKDKYMFLLKLISRDNGTWESMKNEFARNGKKVTDSQLSIYLNELLNYGFIEKENSKYKISDPLYIRAVGG